MIFTSSKSPIILEIYLKLNSTYKSLSFEIRISEKIQFIFSSFSIFFYRFKLNFSKKNSIFFILINISNLLQIRQRISTQQKRKILITFIFALFHNSFTLIYCLKINNNLNTKAIKKIKALRKISTTPCVYEQINWFLSIGTIFFVTVYQWIKPHCDLNYLFDRK